MELAEEGLEDAPRLVVEEEETGEDAKADGPEEDAQLLSYRFDYCVVDRIATNEMGCRRRARDDVCHAREDVPAHRVPDEAASRGHPVIAQGFA